MPPPGPPLSPSILVDEENLPVYQSKYFYPVKPGEILSDRYQTVVKVGWGASSTVWLARDLYGHVEEQETVVALKITNSNASLADHERDVEEHIAATDPSHRGRSILRTLVDSFEVDGPEGSHLCLVYPPLREPLSMYRRRFEDRRMPLPLAKTYIRLLLTGLDYLHKNCRTVHTDLKLDNIMVSFEDPIVLSDFMNSHLEKPMSYKVDSVGRAVYRAESDFGPIRNYISIPQLVDFGMATTLDEDDDWGFWPIQPDHYRAPEVILGTAWQMPADIWNIGALLWSIVGGKELFQHIHDEFGHYEPKRHIAEMIALIGPPTPDVMHRYQHMRDYVWPEPVAREDGSVCATAEEFFGGPFFDGKGRFLFEGLIPERSLDETVSFLEDDEKSAFLDLARRMLVWRPEARKSAGELANHPFLQPK